MTIQTVGDLRRLLDENRWSCEMLAERVAVSNMTWRRLLTQDDSNLLPVKYQALLTDALKDSDEGGASPEFDPIRVVLTGHRKTQSQVLLSLLKDGYAIQADKIRAAAILAARHSIKSPRNTLKLAVELKNHFPRVSLSSQALILAGLAYFLNPMDLINDSIVPFGFLDDLGVLMLIKAKISSTSTS